jgi:hypothetical protein
MQHIEQHFSGSDTVRDVVIGMADGLTVPFALAATACRSCSQRFFRLGLSFAATGLLWSSMMSRAGGWFFLSEHRINATPPRGESRRGVGLGHDPMRAR